MADYVETRSAEASRESGRDSAGTGRPRRSSKLRRGLALGVGYTLIVLAGAMLGYQAHALLQPGDQAYASVLVAPLIGNPYSPSSSSLENMDTEARLVMADAVFLDAAAALGDPSLADELAAATGARIVAGSQVVNVTVEGSSEAVANDRASAIAEAFLGQRQARAEAALAQQSSSIKLAIVAAQRNVDRAVQDVSSSEAGSSERQLARQALNVASSTLASRTDELSALGAVSIVPGQVISTSTSAASAPWPWVLMGGAAGLLVVFVIHVFVLPARETLPRARVKRWQEGRSRTDSSVGR